MSERLQKFLAKAGVGSRRFCEELIKSKKIKINGKVAEIGVSVEITDVIEYEGDVISYVKSDLKLLMLNKPEGVVSSNKKEKNLPLVFDYLPKSNLDTRWISIEDWISIHQDLCCLRMMEHLQIFVCILHL